MKQTLSLITLLALLCSCATSAIDSANKSIASSALTVDAAMTGWAKYVVLNKPPVQQEDSVRSEYSRYQEIMKTVKVAYTVAAAQPTNTSALNASISILNASQASLLGLIQTFTSTSPATLK